MYAYFFILRIYEFACVWIQFIQYVLSFGFSDVASSLFAEVFPSQEID